MVHPLQDACARAPISARSYVASPPHGDAGWGGLRLQVPGHSAAADMGTVTALSQSSLHASFPSGVASTSAMCALIVLWPFPLYVRLARAVRASHSHPDPQACSKVGDPGACCQHHPLYNCGPRDYRSSLCPALETPTSTPIPVQGRETNSAWGFLPLMEHS